MSISRREFIGAAAAGAAMGGVRQKRPETAAIRAIAFDAFALFDPAAVTQAATAAFPRVAATLISTWRQRQFEYCWLRTVAGRYADFRQVTLDALVFAARTAGVELSDAQRDDLMAAHSRLNAWPEAAHVTEELRRAGLRLALLSNLTEAMLDANLAHAGLTGALDHIVSTDRARSYKPSPRAYQLGVDVLGVAPEQILFVASAGWDAAGATLFGYPTFWANRAAAPAEQLDVEPAASGTSLAPLPGLAASMRERAR